MPIHPEDTITIKATITDRTGAKADPGSHEIKIYDPDRTLKATYTDPAKEADGIYIKHHNLAADAKTGTWTIVWKAKIGTRANKGVTVFEVTPTL